MADREDIPTKEEIRKLPRWARVAFAARCARRVQPIFTAACPKSSKEQVEALERAILIAETAAAQGKVNAEAARAAADAATDAARGPNAAYYTASAANNSCYAASAVPEAATFAAKSAALAADHAIYASEFAGFKDEVVSGIWWDFENIKKAAKREQWTDESPVPPESFGPIWPEGKEPKWNLLQAGKPRATKLLTRTEMKVLRFILDGISNKEIANLLHRSVRTIEIHRSHIMRKLGADNLVDLVKRAAAMGLVDLPGGGPEEKLLLRAYVDESTGADDVINGIVELYRELNKYHILCGGSGLTIDDWQVFERKTELAEVS